LVELAGELADAARGETLSRAASGFAVENKAAAGSFDPVTEADRAAEQAMRALIAERYPDHGIAGEEFGETQGTSVWNWSLDPIDGTRSFACGLPTWTTLIALLDRGEPWLGVIDSPRLGERYVGNGERSWCETDSGTTELRCSGRTALGEARLSTTDPFLFRETDAFAALQAQTQTARYGLDAYAYARLAAGTLDLVVECGLKPHDYNALIPVVRGAGGVFGDWSGGTEFRPGSVIAAATRELYDAAVAIMSGGRDAAEAPR
jgi:myo-inositol-1(or 4)-monophosphatase